MLDAWLDLVHGGACVGCDAPGRSLCRACERDAAPQAREVRPTPCPDGLARCWAAGEHAGVLRAAVVAHKEHAAHALLPFLGAALATAVLPTLDQALDATTDPGAATLLVPVPSRAAVVRARGHDPVLRTARSAARVLRRDLGAGRGVAVASLLRQRGAVEDQAGLGSAARGENRRGSLVVRAGARAALARRGRPVALVVVDDVLTTGATAREAQRALEDAGLVVRAVATVAATRRRLAPEALPSRPSGD